MDSCMLWSAEEGETLSGGISSPLEGPGAAREGAWADLQGFFPWAIPFRVGSEKDGKEGRGWSGGQARPASWPRPQAGSIMAPPRARSRAPHSDWPLFSRKPRPQFQASPPSFRALTGCLLGHAHYSSLAQSLVSSESFWTLSPPRPSLTLHRLPGSALSALIGPSLASPFWPRPPLPRRLTGALGQPITHADCEGPAARFEHRHVAGATRESDAAGAASAPALLLHPEL